MAKTKQEISINRPTSPHITIYRKQISSVLSILHRMTGVVLFFSVLIFSWWLILLAFSNFDECYVSMVKNNLLQIICFFTSFAGFYHLCNGIRHLVWDMGKCFSIKAIHITGWMVVVCSTLFTVIFWLF